MKFSITTSFYDTYDYIDSVYSCIKEQTYNNWEWVITDDFSSDTRIKDKLIEISNNDSRVRYIEQSFKKEFYWNPQNFCNGDIVCIMDSDDILYPKALDVYCHFYNKFPDVISISCGANKYNEGGGLSEIDCGDTRRHNDMSGFHENGDTDRIYVTYFRSWRNIKVLNLDFNPDNWMKYFYADIAVSCKLEEHGKILILPRDLYTYIIRPNSMSRSASDIADLWEENKILVQSIFDNRRGKDLDSICRYFEPIYGLSNMLFDKDFHNVKSRKKISIFGSDIISYEKRLLRELYYDYEIIFNKIEDSVDKYFIYIDNDKDVEYMRVNLQNILTMGTASVCIFINERHRFDSNDNVIEDRIELGNSVINYLDTMTCYRWFILRHMWINIDK